MTRKIGYPAAIAILVLMMASQAVRSRTPPQPDRFLAEVKAVADYGDLHDTETVGRLLHTSFTAGARSTLDGPCRLGGEASDTRISDFQDFTPATDFWFRSQPDGVHAMTVPGWLGPSTKLGQPQLRYSVSHRTTCGDARHPALDETTADLDFDAVPGFSCITEDQLKAALPDVKHVIATDGAWPYDYQGRRLETDGTHVIFSYVFKPQCLIGVRIEQSTTYGARYVRARARMDACMSKAAVGLQAAGRPFTVGDEVAACKPFWDYLAEEPKRD